MGKSKERAIQEMQRSADDKIVTIDYWHRTLKKDWRSILHNFNIHWTPEQLRFSLISLQDFWCTEFRCWSICFGLCIQKTLELIIPRISLFIDQFLIEMSERKWCTGVEGLPSSLIIVGNIDACHVYWRLRWIMSNTKQKRTLWFSKINVRFDLTLDP